MSKDVKYSSPLYQFPAGERVVAWKSHIDRLVAESKEPETAQMWGAHDYFAALFIRNTIAALPVGEFLSEGELALLREADQACLGFTEPDELGLVIHYGDPGYLSPEWWWWRRMPASGAAYAELTSWWEDRVRTVTSETCDVFEESPRSAT